MDTSQQKTGVIFSYIKQNTPYLLESLLLSQINRLPDELKRYIRDYLPISTVKYLRKINECEFPDDYKELILKKSCLFKLHDNFLLLSKNDKSYIKTINTIIERNKMNFKRDITASWFDYLDNSMSLYNNLENVTKSYENNKDYQEQCFNEFMRIVGLIKKYGIIPKEEKSYDILDKNI